MNDVIDGINKLSKSYSVAMKELHQMNTRVVEQLAEQQLSFANICTEYTTSQLDLLSGDKSYSDIIAGQTKIISGLGEKVQGIAKNTVDILNESTEDMSAWVEKGVKDVTKQKTSRSVKAV